MRSARYFLISLVLLILALQLTAAAHLPLHIRQDDQSPSSEQSQTQSTVKDDSTQASISATASADSSQDPSSPASQTARATRSSNDLPVSTSVLVSTTAGTSSPTTSNGAQTSSTTAPADADVLPIQPKITPAMGISGVILLISGAVYAFIGIKNKWLYVFGSAAYLTSLSVTVLIIYLMSPPVSDAIQGGFFVAAFLTGIIFGALSLVFADLTDGLGCLLGGFCLSMWLLTVKEDGLIASSTGKGIFIGCMSAAGYSLSFSHHTRNYGLIVCISFAGATAAMLGIDCLSRAGWKEFWLYVWNLNENTFPLNTNHYPMTRGIKVELACVVVVNVLAIMSQLKLWRLVKERREKSAAARVEREQELQRQEEERGLKLEAENARDRAQWEATYGNKAMVQASVTETSEKMTPKTSISSRDRDYSSDSIEMANLTPSRDGSMSHSSKNGPTATVTMLQDIDEIQTIDGNRASIAAQNDNVTALEAAANDEDHTRALADNAPDHNAPDSPSGRVPLQVSVAPPPEVVPLPFKIPIEEDVQSVDVDNASVSAMQDSMAGTPTQRRSLANRLSGGSIMKRFSSKAVAEGGDEARHSLIVPHIEDDRASSLAATLDDGDDAMSIGRLSNLESPIRIVFNEPDGEPANTTVEGVVMRNRDLSEQPAKDGAQTPTTVDTESGAKSSGIDTPLTDPTDSLTISTNPKPGEKSRRESSNSYRHRSDTVVSGGDKKEKFHITKSLLSGTVSDSTHSSSQAALSKDVLPEKMSKVALSYRTNEWAKHLALAETPDLDDIPEPSSPGIQLADPNAEAPAPVTDEIMGIEVTKRSSRRASAGANVVPKGELNRSMSKASVQDMRRTSATPAVVRITSKRTSSNPYFAQVGDGTNSRQSMSPAAIPPSHTLLGQRETLVRNKMSTQSFAAPSPSPEIADQDNMTLAQRKALIQTQNQLTGVSASNSASKQWRQSNIAALGPQMQSFDSHQPRRSVNNHDPTSREVRLANWRESVRQESNGAPVLAAMRQASGSDDPRRIAMMNDQRAKEMEKQRREAERAQRESMMDNMMRSGQMMDAHREAMRKMQAKANRRAT